MLSAKRLGYTHLRPDQQKASVSFLMSNDVFVNLPTRSGKSLWYAMLPIASDKRLDLTDGSFVVVVSPLIA